MPVILTIGLPPDGGTRLTGFTHFWLRYVRGFSPHFHCQRSLRGGNDPRFNRRMEVGTAYELREPKHYQYIYLCGLTSRRNPGLHLALLPEADASAYALTYNGIEIQVTGAKQLEIDQLPDGFAGFGRKFTSCRNWQFGVKYCGLDNIKAELVRD